MKRNNRRNTVLVIRIILLASVALFFCFNLFLETTHALNGADVALYNDSIAPSGFQGVWQDGLTAIKNMLTTIGFTFEEITYQDLNESTQNFSNLYKVILFPGGTTQWYNYWISKAGKTRIRNFINAGKGFFGICAGAYFACDRIVWDGVTYDDHSGYNAYGELTGFDLDLFPGTGTGPINEIAHYYSEGYNMTTINFQNANSVLTNYKQTPFTEDILYYGGPYFTLDAGSAVEVLGAYQYNGQPAMVASTYGSGRVALCGPHPEIEEDSDRDGVTLPREETMNDNGSDWELVKHILNWLMKKSNLPSCPSLYFWDGDEYVREGSILAGAFYQEKEYRDHIPLSQLVPANGEYYLQIRETERERSFIDMAYLIVIDHISNNNDPASQNKDPGFAGSIIQHWILAPTSATHSMIGDVSGELRYPDDQYVQMGTGEIITLAFPYLPEMGIQRDFIFIVEGFYIPTEIQ